MAEGYTVAELLTRIAANMDLTPDAGVNDTRIYQAITAAGMGCQSAMQAAKYIEDTEF